MPWHHISPIPDDPGLADIRGESVAGARRRCGSGETRVESRIRPLMPTHPVLQSRPAAFV